MPGITLTIAIPEYWGEYENAMRRLVNINNDETYFFKLFFTGYQGLGFSLDDETALRLHAYQFTTQNDADAIYAEYSIFLKGRENVDFVNMVYRDLVFIFNHIRTFYRTQPFTSRLLQQVQYLDKKIFAQEIIPNGLIIRIE